MHDSKLTASRTSRKDYDLIYDLERRTFGVNECFTRSHLRHLLSSSTASFFLLRDGDVPVGFGIALRSRLRNGRYRGRIYSIGVLPEYRSQGAGNILLNEMEGYLIKSGVSFIVLETLKGKGGAELFFAKQGYGVSGFSPQYYPYGDAVKMRKDVNREAAKSSGE